MKISFLQKRVRVKRVPVNRSKLLLKLGQIQGKFDIVQVGGALLYYLFYHNLLTVCANILIISFVHSGSDERNSKPRNKQNRLF
jgi:hypothetical protein